jgi:hypothetical protein
MTTRIPDATDLRIGTILEVGLLTSRVRRMMVLARRSGSVYMTRMSPASPADASIVCRSERRVNLMFRAGEWRIAEFKRLSMRENAEMQSLLHTQFPAVFREQDSMKAAQRDVPRAFRDSEVLAGREALLDAPHVEPLNTWVRDVRRRLGPAAIVPWFDPGDGGVEARILWLLPGPKATRERGGSGIVSCNQQRRDGTEHMGDKE